MYLYCWLVVSTPLKNIVSWDDYSQLNGKIKHVPNHQPVFVLCMLQFMSKTYDGRLFFAFESRYGDVQKQNTTYPPARKRGVLESCRFIDDFPGLRVIDGG